MAVHVDIRTLAKALALGACAASCPGLIGLVFAVAAPLAILIPVAAFGIAFVFGALFGLPMYFALERFGWANPLTAALWGMVVANLFLLLVVGPEWMRGGSIAQAVPGMLIFACLGAMGGGAFYKVVDDAPCAEPA